MGVVRAVAVGRSGVSRRQLGVDTGRRPRTAGARSRPGRSCGAIGAVGTGGIHTRGTQDLVDDVGLLAPGVCVERHRLGYRPKLLALFAF